VTGMWEILDGPVVAESTHWAMVPQSSPTSIRSLSVNLENRSSGPTRPTQEEPLDSDHPVFR